VASPSTKISIERQKQQWLLIYNEQTLAPRLFARAPELDHFGLGVQQ
jgi:hypothetical protein